MVDITFTALCFLAHWEQELNSEGGVAFEGTLRRVKLLDYSVGSLHQIDRFLDQIRIQKRPTLEVAIRQAQYVNLLYLLAFYVGEVIGRVNGVPVSWTTMQETRGLDPFGEEPEALSRLTCWVRREQEGRAQPFWPWQALMSRLFESGDDKSITLSASLVMRGADHAESLPPLAPVYLPFKTQERVAGMSDVEFGRLRLASPVWMRDDPLGALLNVEDDLLRHGYVTWAVPVQVNSSLFSPTWDRGAPGELLYDPTGRASVDAMSIVASAIYRLKTDNSRDGEHTPEEAEFAYYLREETIRVFGKRVPRTVCSYPLQVSSTFISRSHLPDGTLAMRSLPVLVHQDHPGMVVPLPAALWPEVLRQEWMDASEQRYGKRFTAEELRNGAMAPPSVEEQYNMAMEQYALADQGPENLNMARVLWERNAARGHPPSLMALGNLYARGHGVPENPRQAFQYFLAAAKLGDVVAQVAVAENLLLIDGVGCDLVKAEEWLRKAASSGSSRARHLLIENGFDDPPGGARRGFLGRLFSR